MIQQFSDADRLALFFRFALEIEKHPVLCFIQDNESFTTEFDLTKAIPEIKHSFSQTDLEHAFMRLRQFISKREALYFGLVAKSAEGVFGANQQLAAHVLDLEKHITRDLTWQSLRLLRQVSGSPNDPIDSRTILEILLYSGIVHSDRVLSGERYASAYSTDPVVRAQVQMAAFTIGRHLLQNLFSFRMRILDCARKSGRPIEIAEIRDLDARSPAFK